MVVYIASMTTRINISTGSPFEPLRGYSRAVQQGDMLFISGTTALNAMGDVVAPVEPYAQTIAILNKVRTMLTSRNFAVSDVVRTRIFVTNIVKWEDYARAHSDFFEKIRPASSLVQVAKLVDPRLVVEIEVDAIRGASSVENVALDL